jgi:hypothetical protein
MALLFMLFAPKNPLQSFMVGWFVGHIVQAHGQVRQGAQPARPAIKPDGWSCTIRSEDQRMDEIREGIFLPFFFIVPGAFRADFGQISGRSQTC